MAFTDDAAEVLRRAARLSGPARLDELVETYEDRPLLRATLEGILNAEDTSWLETGGAWDPRFEERIHEALRVEPLAIGDRVGDVRIRGRLGAGGMGTVYLGFDERLEREVAVKTMSLDGRERLQARERFEREARALSRLNHPAICQIYSLIDASVGEHSFQCLVLERMHGETLSQALGNLDLDSRLQALEQVARALAVAHGEGIIHRDLKPDNVMLTPEGEVKILDFGIARFSDAESSPAAPEPKLDETGESLIGTPRYMSPEQALCEPLSPASDLYSLGLLLKEAVTDSPAHPEASTPYDLVRRAAEAEVEPLDESVDPEVAGLIGDLLAREPSARPSAADAADRIRRVLERPQRVRRHRIRLAFAVLLAVALVVAVWASIGAWMARRDAELQSVAARKLGEEVRSVDSLLRAAHLAPPHDVTTERLWVEDRLRRIEQEFGSSGSWAEGPLAYARGRIALALGRLDEARAALEEGWRLGYRDPRLAEGLGLAFGALYDSATDEARRLATEDQRRAALDEADRTLRQPAVEWLRRASVALDGSGPDQGQLAESWLALYENRFDDARELAVRTLDDAPWLYEALRIRGLAGLREAAGLEASGRMEKAAESLTAAEVAVDEALIIARSDPELHIERCGLGIEAITLAYRTGWEGVPPYERAIGACRTARRLLPGDPAPFLAEARLEHALAWSRSEILQDPTEALDRLAVVAETARQLDPESAEAHRLLGIEASARGDWRGNLGQPGRVHFEKAEEFLDRAVELDPDTTSHHFALGVALFSLGFEELVTGADPRPSLLRAVGSLERARELSPGSYSAPSMMGSAYGVMGMYALENGLDPLKNLRRSVESFEAALAVEPGAPAPRGNLVMAYRDLATYHWLVGNHDEVELAADRGRLSAKALIAAKPDSASARISLGELELVFARSRIERGLDAGGDLGSVLQQAEELEDLEVTGADSMRLRSVALFLLAVEASDSIEELERLTDEGFREAERWVKAGGSYRPWLLKARLAELRARRGLQRSAEIRRGLEAVNRALTIRDGSGEALLLRAKLLILAGRPDAEVRQALDAAVQQNRWLERQARQVASALRQPSVSSTSVTNE